MKYLLIAVLMLWVAGCSGSEDAGTPETKDTVVEKKAPAAGSMQCAGCVALKDAGTGWCADCGTGYYEGKEVNCKNQCRANPGGPPCQACVK